MRLWYVIIQATSEGSCEPTHPCNLARAFAVHTRNTEVDEGFDQKSDIKPHCMAGHAHLRMIYGGRKEPLSHDMAQKYMSHVMRKPVYAICEQQRRRSACASPQSDQHPCCSLPR